MTDAGLRLLRPSRLTLAYALLGLFALPGVLAFFFVKAVMPNWLLHPEHVTWLISACRLLIQIVAGSAVLVPALLIYLRLVDRFLNESELAYLRNRLNE